jgi:CDP-paratose 2-epimerase
MGEFINCPRSAAVYNIGGGKENSCSILEAFEITEKFSEIRQVYSYVDENRIGDHICYYSDLRKMKTDYPNWNISHSLEDTIEQIIECWKSRNSTTV